MNGGLFARGDQLYFGLHLVQGTIFETDLSGRIRRMIEFGSGPGASAVGGLAVDGEGFIYAADPTGQRLRVFTPTGQEAGSIGEDRAPYLAAGLQLVDRAGVLEDPNDVAVDAEGDIYVACGEQFMHNGLQKFSSLARHVRSFPSMGDPNGTFGGPRGLALDPDGSLLVCDTLHHRLQRFSRDGRFLGVLGPPHGDLLTSPVSVTVLPSGDLLVAESGRLVVLSPDGLRRCPFAPRRVDHATDVCRSGDDVFVLERDFGVFGIRVGRFDLAGNLLAQPVVNLEDLVRKATVWLKAQAGSEMPEATAWHKIGALHHYVLPDTAAAFRIASGSYRRALKADPGSFEARLDLAELLMKRSRRGEARALYLECLALRPQDESVRLRLALLLRGSGQEAAAREVLLAGLERRPDSSLLREEIDRLT